MNILDLIRKGADIQVYGAGGTRRSSRIQRMSASGSNYPYDVEAGPLYDNGIVLPAINWKVNAISEAELIVESFDSAKGKWVRAGETGPVANALAALRTPNDYYDLHTMLYGTQLSWDTRGQSFLLKRRSITGQTIGFYWAPHFQMRPMADRDNDGGTKLITYYEYQPLGGSFAYLQPADVVHLRHGIDPKDPASGLSPLAATLRDVCSDNEVSTWLAALLRNGATPGSILVPKVSDAQPPTPEQRAKLKDLWNSFVRDKRGEAFMMPLPIDVVTPGFSPQQMELGKLREIPTARICSALGLDPMVLGLPSESKTYSNYEEAADASGKRTILPAINRWALQLTKQVLPDFQLSSGFRFGWDVSAVSWLQDEVNELHERAREDYKSGAIDRYRAKEMMGEVPDESDKGVYATDFKGVPTQLGQDPKDPTSKTPPPKASKMIERARARRREFESAA